MKPLLTAGSLITLALTAHATPAFNWTGFYAGANLGAVNHTLDLTDADGTTFLATIRQESNPKWTACLQTGYRRQIDMTGLSGVYGAELDLNFANAEFEKQYGSSFALYSLHSDNQLKITSTVEALAGLAADRVLLFLTGGFS